MSIALYNKTVHECNSLITKRYSTSFTLGIRMLGRKYQEAIYSVYGYVRLADEIVDTFHDHDKKTLLNEFEHDTWMAIERGVSTNPGDTFVFTNRKKIQYRSCLDPIILR